MQKDLNLGDVSLGAIFTDKYALWVDLRTTDDDSLYGRGRRVENTGEGITSQIIKELDVSGSLTAYLYIAFDAQLIIEDSRFKNVIY